MIFYFSGTGNSLYVARKIADRMDTTLINMADLRFLPHHYEREENEPVGFVFPVYFYSVNDVVYDFIRNLTIAGEGYTFVVVTCGESIGAAGAYLKELLAKRNIPLDACFPLVMTDNAMIYYNISDTETAKDELTRSDEQLNTIMEQIQAGEKTVFGSPKQSEASRLLYHAMARTGKYHVTEKCIGCGQCAKNCPDKAIALLNKKPTWVKHKCTFCMGCINRCPVSAIEYGKRTAGRNRYKNPEVC